MRYSPINPKLFATNRKNLQHLMLPNSLAVVNANDILPTNADGALPLKQNSDLFYFTGIEQEETRLLIFPDAQDDKFREILFIRDSNPLLETWEGHKLTREEARDISGIERVEWMSNFDSVFHQLMCECEHIYLNSNEHKRARVIVETRDARFIKETQAKYPLHDYQRLAPLIHQLRPVKSKSEIKLIQQACDITEAAFRRVCKFVKPGVNEMEIEAEFAHEFIRSGGAFAYTPIIASGKNNCVLHYLENSRTCRKGELLLLDVGASYANYNADMTRTIPVSGRFTKRQKQIYNAVLRVMRAASDAATPGKLPRDWQKDSEALMEKELVDLKLLKMSDIKKQDANNPAVKKYFMHGIGHPLGLDVHDVARSKGTIQEDWVLTVEPGIYIPEEGFGIRLENDVLVRESGNIDLMANIPIEADEIEALMK